MEQKINFSLTTADLSSIDNTCILIGIFKDKTLTKGGKQIDALSNKKLATSQQVQDFNPTLGACGLLYNSDDIAAEKILLLGLGEREKLDDDKLAQAAGAACKFLHQRNINNVCSLLHLVEDDKIASKIQKITTACANAIYSFDYYKTKAQQQTTKNINFAHHVNASDANLEQAMLIGDALAKGMSLAKDLGNQPGNIATPKFLAKQAKLLEQEFSSIKSSSIDESELEAMGAGAFVSVAKGSAESGKLIVMQYLNANAQQKPIVLVGKAVTFDTGGISLKPGAAMDEMKYDMCGGASVFGTLKALATIGAKVNVIGLVAAAENMPAGDASKPGDIVTTLSGQTVEILNTDAEGRLVLCDTLTYAKKYQPEVVIDIATLTGACVIALGKVPSAMMSNDEQLAADLNAAAAASGDKIWRMPIWEEYQSQLDSNFADMQNIGGRDGGAITAACFLARFTKDYRWAHLDIAGTAWHSGKNKGATGRPVPLLLEYILQHG